MKDYKLLLVGLIVLLLIIFIGIFTWLWQSNRKNIDPLPIMVKEEVNAQSSTNNLEEADKANTILYIQAEEKLQAPLDDVITKFESRYPNLQVLARYVSPKLLLTLPDTKISDKKSSPFIVNIDVIIADDRLTKDRLLPLQAQLNRAQEESNKSNANAQDSAATNNTNSEIINNDTAHNDTVNNEVAVIENQTDNTEARSLVSFSYAIKDKQVVNGVILTDSPVAISFRNFLLSSVGQDILKKYNYDNIDGYKNGMDDLFNPSSGTTAASNDSSIKIADALSNGQ